jgi:hypothetical protein
MFRLLCVAHENGQVEKFIVKILGDNHFITFKEGAECPEHQEYLAWVAEGNTAEEWTGE